MRILLVEDDEMIGEAVADGLKGEGYAVDWVKDGNSAIIALDTTPFSLVILDLGLPGKDGLAVLKEIRFRKNHTPVLVIRRGIRQMRLQVRHPLRYGADLVLQ